MFTQKQCYGSRNFPWSPNNDVVYKYGNGTCPVAERINNDEYLGIFMVGSNFEDNEVEMMAEAINKVYSNLSELT